MQLDPIGVKGGLNRYVYVRNSPTNYTDPSGLCPMCFGAVIGASVEIGFQLYTGELQTALSAASNGNWQSLAVSVGKVTASAGAGAVGAGIGGKLAQLSVTTQLAGNSAAGATLGASTKVAGNVAEGKDVTSNLPQASLAGAVGGFAGAGAGALNSKYVSGSAANAISEASPESLLMSVGLAETNSGAAASVAVRATAISEGTGMLIGNITGKVSEQEINRERMP